MSIQPTTNTMRDRHAHGKFMLKFSFSYRFLSSISFAAFSLASYSNRIENGTSRISSIYIKDIAREKLGRETRASCVAKENLIQTLKRYSNRNFLIDSNSTKTQLKLN